MPTLVIERRLKFHKHELFFVGASLVTTGILNFKKEKFLPPGELGHTFSFIWNLNP